MSATTPAARSLISTRKNSSARSWRLFLSAMVRTFPILPWPFTAQRSCSSTKCPALAGICSPGFSALKRSVRSSARAPGAAWWASIAVRLCVTEVLSPLHPRGSIPGLTRTAGSSKTTATQPSLSAQDGWVVENHGVDPDYVVPQRPDLVVEGHDPQLEKAIELAKEALKDYKGLPPRPKFPGSK